MSNKVFKFQGKVLSEDSRMILAAELNHKYTVEYLLNAGANIHCSLSYNNYTVLHYASEYGWLDIVESLLKKGADIHLRTKDGDSPLMLAAKEGEKGIFKLLVNAGADIHCYSLSHWTVLHYAAQSGCLEIVEYLLDKGADTQVKTEDGICPLQLAAKNGHKNVVELLVNAGANVNCFVSPNNNYTVLHYASENGWSEIVQSLIERGADFDVRTKHGDSPLTLAAKENGYDIVKNLIDAGACVNCSYSLENYTMLHYASRYGWLDIVQILLKKGLNIEEKSKYGESPLLLAAKHRKLDIFKYLLNVGADINFSNSPDNFTALHYASNYGWYEIVPILLSMGVDIQAKTNHGDSPLILAANEEHKEIVDFLLNAGADINCSGGKDNFTVLHYSSRNGWLDIVKSVLKEGANIEAKSSKGETSLYIACMAGKIKVAEYLISAGADVNVKSNECRSLLSDMISVLVDRKNHAKLLSSYTSLRGIKLMCPLLIKSGAYLNLVDYTTMRKSILEEYILQDCELCCQAIINEFNYKVLPELYEHAIACSTLPRIENMIIGNDSREAHEVMQCVKHEIQEKGHCNVFEVRPKVLKMLSLKSSLSYCESIKEKQDRASKRMKMSADFDNHNQLATSQIS